MNESKTLSTPDSFSSIEEMRNAHGQLLENLPEDILGVEDAKQLKKFLKSGAMTGTVLDRVAERREAQGLLDYWASTFYSEFRPQKDTPQDIKRLTDSETVLEPFDIERVRKLGANADRVLTSYDENQKTLARKILLRLTKLDNDYRIFTRTTSTESALESLGNPSETRKIIADLKESGVIQLIENEEDKTPVITLSAIALIRVWAQLRKWCDKRLEFHEAAQFWAQNGRDPAALLSDGPLLEEASSYRDLGDLEQDFADASRKQQTKNKDRTVKRLIIAIISITSVTILGFLISFFVIRSQLRTINEHRLAIAANLIEIKDTATKLEQEQNTLSVVQNELLKTEEEFELAAEKFNKTKSSAFEQLVELQTVRNQQVTDIGTIFDSLPEEEKGDFFKNKDKSKIEGYLKEFETLKTKSQAAQEQTSASSNVIKPGSRIGPTKGRIQGTAGFFVKDQQGRVFMVAPQFVFGNEPEDDITQFDSSGKAAKPKFAKVWPYSGRKSFKSMQLSLAKVADNRQVTNKISNSISIKGIAKNVQAGDEIFMVGASSGEKTGRIQNVAPDRITIDQQLELGDAGAPVLTKDGNLVGITIATASDRSIVLPVDAFLRESGLTLLEQ